MIGMQPGVPVPLTTAQIQAVNTNTPTGSFSAADIASVLASTAATFYDTVSFSRYQVNASKTQIIPCTDNVLRYVGGMPTGTILDAYTGTSLTTTRGATPDQIAGLQFWLDAQQPMFTASYAAQCVNDGDVIAFWPDRAGIGNVPISPSVGSPTYKKSAINGYPAVNFGGTSRFVTPAINLATCTIFVVHSAVGLASNQVALGAAANAFYLAKNGSTHTIDFVATGLTIPSPQPCNWSTEYGIMMARYDSATLSVEFDRQFANNGPSASNSVSTMAATGVLAGSVAVTIGDLAGGGFAWPSYIGEVLIYNVALSQENVRQVYDYLQQKWGINTNLVVCTGDSITSGTGSTGGPAQTMLTPVGGTNYPNRLWSLLGSSTWQVKADAYPGRTLIQMNTETSTYGDLYFSPRGASKNINIVWGGTNDCSSYTSVGSAMSLYEKLCLQKKALGWKVVAVTMLLRQDGAAPGISAFAINQAQFNTWLRANYTRFADTLVDVAADSRLQNPSNTTYFNADKIHLTDAGYIVVANLMYAVVSTL
jgi:lysophospholipase L1-like esterase